MSAAGQRHLSTTSFGTYLRSGVPVEHPIPGTPRIHLFIDPERAVVGVRAPADTTDPPQPTGLEHLRAAAVHHHGRRMFALTVNDPRLFVDAYPVLCAVADRIQLQRNTFHDAVRETLRRLDDLLGSEASLSRDREVGLVGELALLIGLIRTGDTSTALDAWRGGQSEEHDFGMPSDDIEVKTTTSERRTHWITDIRQMINTGERPLWLVSYQITRGGAGGPTLADLIGRARDALSSSPAREILEKKLHQAGWRDHYADTQMERWRMRSTPVAFHVASGFPRLTHAAIEKASDPARIVEVRYRIDLSDLQPDRAPGYLESALRVSNEELR